MTCKQSHIIFYRTEMELLYCQIRSKDKEQGETPRILQIARLPTANRNAGTNR